jgi:hypothetical protein
MPTLSRQRLHLKIAPRPHPGTPAAGLTRSTSHLFSHLLGCLAVQCATSALFTRRAPAAPRLHLSSFFTSSWLPCSSVRHLCTFNKVLEILMQSCQSKSPANEAYVKKDETCHPTKELFPVHFGLFPVNCCLAFGGPSVGSVPGITLCTRITLHII